MPDLSLLVFGSVYHSFSVDEFTHHPLVSIGVDAEGKISLFNILHQEEGTLSAELRSEKIRLETTKLKEAGWKVHEILILDQDQFIIPGFVDTHIHAPQYVFTGTGYDLNLLKWLETYTFPREAAFSNQAYAIEAHGRCVRRTLSCGTTTACYFATTHKSSSIILANTCASLGQRAFIGKVNMDRNSPDYYIETTEESIKETLDFVKHVVESLNSPLVTPCITPRFVPSCTSALMVELGSIASKHNLPIQSHLSESPGEIAWVKELHPENSSYSDVYDQFGLLTDRTVMAHCIHLSKGERDLLLERKVGISHCPSSNFCLHSGVLNIRRLLEEGYEKVGLGTDCAGGYSPSIMDAMRQALIASKVVHIDSHASDSETKEFKALNFAQVFYLATLGGARVMGLEGKIGNFVVGKDFDALVIDPSSKQFIRPHFTSTMTDLSASSTPMDVAAINVDIFPHDDHLSVFEKFIYLGDDRCLSRVYVRGRRII